MEALHPSQHPTVRAGRAHYRQIISERGPREAAVVAEALARPGQERAAVRLVPADQCVTAGIDRRSRRIGEKDVWGQDVVGLGRELPVSSGRLSPRRVKVPSVPVVIAVAGVVPLTTTPSSGFPELSTTTPWIVAVRVSLASTFATMSASISTGVAVAKSDASRWYSATKRSAPGSRKRTR